MAIVKYLCNDGTFDTRDTEFQGRQDVVCRNKGGVAIDYCAKENFNENLCNIQRLKKETTNNAPVNVPQGVGQAKKTFLDEHKHHLIMIGVPLGFYAFSKYKKYDSKKTAKVTIVGSVVVLGLIALNGFSGAWTGTTIMDRTFGKQKYW